MRQGQVHGTTGALTLAERISILGGAEPPVGVEDSRGQGRVERHDEEAARLRQALTAVP